VYAAEEQQLLRDAYQASFLANPGIELVGISGDTTGESLANIASAVGPDVVILGTKVLKQVTVKALEQIRESSPEVGLVLLSAQYDVEGIKALREFSRRSSGGCAYLLKHTIDTVEQLIDVIHSVAQGRIIVDPMVMEGLIDTGEARGKFLKELSPRELEVLSWIAKGYRNNTIAEILFLEPKTVERHINNIYTKLDNHSDSRHARVAAVRMYLKATGQLPVEELDGE
jgi:DNA-binding NarL/FixJ family response regulator